MKTLLALAAILFSSLPVTSSTSQVPEQTVLLVRLQPAATAAGQQDLLGPLEATVVGGIPQLNVLALSVPAGRAAEALAALDKDPSVAYAEPDSRAWAAFLPDDPGWALQWGPQKIGASAAWDVTVGSAGVIVAVVDSGVTLDHPDLANQLWTNAGEVPANRLDDDGNGQVDDVWGWHYYHRWDGEAFLPGQDSVVVDDYGHGTHVAGIAGAEIDNGLGIAGMAGGGRLMAVKVLDQYGIGWYLDIAQGIAYAVDNGAQIVNLSLGGTAPSETLQAAVDYARAQGVLVVAAAGNTGGPVLYPAACDHVLAVAASDSDDGHPDFSNYGPEVDVAAPGVDIYSTWPWRDGYWTQSGTSTAAPHVAGLAALLLSRQPALTVDRVARIITRTALDVQAQGWDPYSGWGRVDAQAAMLRAEWYPLELWKTAAPLQQAAGAPVTYTISFGNEGIPVAGIVVADSLPPGVAFASADPPGSYDPASQQLVWGPLTLTTGAQVTVTVVATIGVWVPPGAKLTNTVTLFHDGLAQPLVAAASHQVPRHQAYLPIVLRASSAE